MKYHERPALILGTFLTALHIGRSLGRKGIPVYGLDWNGRQSAGASRYIKFLETGPTDESLVQRMKEIGDEHKLRPVLFVTSDTYLSFLLRCWNEVLQCALLPGLDRTILAALVKKESMHRILSASGVPLPNTVVIRNEAEVDKLRTLPSGGLIIKPDFHDNWLRDPEFIEEYGQRKVFAVDHRHEAARLIPKLIRYDRVIVQELVEGPTDNLFYYIGYRSKAGKFLASFVGRKIRTYPEKFGSETMFSPARNLSVREIAESVAEKLNYVGIIGIDIKYDARDAAFKVIEVNPRFGLSDGITVGAGVDLPHLYYCDVQGRKVEPVLDYRTDVVWYWLEPNFSWYRDGPGLKSAGIFGALRRRLLKKYVYLVFDAGDLLPFLIESGKFLQWLSRGVFRKIKQKVSLRRPSLVVHPAANRY